MNKNLSKEIWIYTVAIICIGLMALYSASYQNSRVSQEVFYQQLFGAFLGLGIMYLFGRIDYRRFYDGAYLFYVFNIILLILVHAVGRHALGAQRWLEIGSLSFQPSELSKLAIILVLGRYYSNRRPNLSFNFLSRTQVILKDIG